MVTFENASTPARGSHVLVKRIVKRELGEPLPVWKIGATALIMAGLAVNLLWRTQKPVRQGEAS